MGRMNRLSDGGLGRPWFRLQMLLRWQQLWMGSFRPLFLGVVLCHRHQLCIAFLLGEVCLLLCWLDFPFLAIVPIFLSIFWLFFFDCGFLLRV